jgi:hypothetical protein
MWYYRVDNPVSPNTEDDLCWHILEEEASVTAKGTSLLVGWRLEGKLNSLS